MIILLFKSMIPASLRRLATGKVANVRAYYRPGKKEIPISTSENVKRGNGAMSHVLASHQDFKHAMHRNGLGWIDFVWGDTGKPVTKSGKRRGAHGISHIIEARQRKDGLTLQQSRILAMMMVQTIAKGRVIRSKKHEATINVLVRHRRYEAVLVKPQNGNSWVLSGWKGEE